MAITYTPTTNFGAKDSLPTNDPAKVIKGAEFSTEFTAIQTAFGQAAPLASPTFTGTVTFNNVTATGTVTLSSVDINGGTIDGTPIGANSASTGAFTTLTASGDVDVADKIVHTGDTNTSIRFPAADTVTVETAGSERLRIDASGDVGYNGKLFSSNDLTTLGGLQLYRDHATGSCYLFDTTAAPFSGPLIFGTNNAEAMRLDASGNLLVGKITSDLTTDGFEVRPTGFVGVRTSGDPLYLNRKSTDGAIATFAKDGTAVGSIGVNSGDLTVGTGDTGLTFEDAADVIHPINQSTGAARDNAIDLGKSAARFKDLYLGGNALIGTTAVTGSLSNTARVTGGIFSTNNGTTSVPNATWTTLTAIPTGDAVYLVTAYLPSSGDPVGYNAVSIVTTSLTGTDLVDIKNANHVALRMSGSNLQVNHGQGTTQPINWSILRLA